VLTAEGHALVGELMFEALEQLPACRAVCRRRARRFVLSRARVAHQLPKGPPSAALYVRKEQKDHGSKRLVEGDRAIVPDMPVVVLEDVITTGGSTLKAIDRLVQAGLKVVVLWPSSTASRAAPRPFRRPAFRSSPYRPAGTTSRIDRSSCSLVLRWGA